MEQVTPRGDWAEGGRQVPSASQNLCHQEDHQSRVSEQKREKSEDERGQ